MKHFMSLIISMVMTYSFSFAQAQSIPLWEETVPNSKESGETEIKVMKDVLVIEKVQIPDLALFFPPEEKSTGQAILICPGGGYGCVSYEWEGTEIAEWLNSLGIAAFVLKYRLPNSKSIVTRYEAPLQDVQRAIRIVRHNAHNWNIDKNKIGVMGFSAGGHLAATLGTHYNHNSLAPSDVIDSTSARPDFMILVYPVITMMNPLTHQGSKWNLLGDSPTEELVKFYSNELHVQENTPITFLTHASDDDAVPVDNSILFYQALKKKNVPAEIHLYPQGGHGFSLATENRHLKTWTENLERWLEHIR